MKVKEKRKIDETTIGFFEKLDETGKLLARFGSREKKGGGGVKLPNSEIKERTFLPTSQK